MCDKTSHNEFSFIMDTDICTSFTMISVTVACYTCTVLCSHSTTWGEENEYLIIENQSLNKIKPRNEYAAVNT